MGAPQDRSAQSYGLGPGNVPERYIRPPDDHLDAAVIERETRLVGMWATFLDEILDWLGAARPTRDELVEYLTTGVIPADVAERFAAAFSTAGTAPTTRPYSWYSLAMRPGYGAWR